MSDRIVISLDNIRNILKQSGDENKDNQLTRGDCLDVTLNSKNEQWENCMYD